MTTRMVLDVVWNAPLYPAPPFPVHGHAVKMAWTTVPGTPVELQVGQLLLPKSTQLRYDKLSTGESGFVVCGRETTSVQTAVQWFLESCQARGPYDCEMPCGTVFALQ